MNLRKDNRSVKIIILRLVSSRLIKTHEIRVNTCRPLVPRQYRTLTFLKKRMLSAKPLALSYTKLAVQLTPLH